MNGTEGQTEWGLPDPSEANERSRVSQVTICAESFELIL